MYLISELRGAEVCGETVFEVLSDRLPQKLVWPSEEILIQNLVTEEPALSDGELALIETARMHVLFSIIYFLKMVQCRLAWAAWVMAITWTAWALAMAWAAWVLAMAWAALVLAMA